MMNARIRELKARLITSDGSPEDVEDLGVEIIRLARQRKREVIAEWLQGYDIPEGIIDQCDSVFTLERIGDALRKGMHLTEEDRAYLMKEETNDGLR